MLPFSIRWCHKRLEYAALDRWRVRIPWITCPIRELEGHEAVGHTISRHISIPLEVLYERLAAEGRTAVSSFWDTAIARAAINYALMTEFDAVTSWFLTGTIRRFPLDVVTPAQTSIGYGVIADGPALLYSSEVHVVLQREGRTFFVLTAYPKLL